MQNTRTITYIGNKLHVGAYFRRSYLLHVVHEHSLACAEQSVVHANDEAKVSVLALLVCPAVTHSRGDYKLPLAATCSVPSLHRQLTDLPSL